MSYMKNSRGPKSGRGRGGDRFGSRNSGSRDFSFRPGRGRFNGRDGDRPDLHDAVCADCGQPCQVPFRPSGDRPIYCATCFRNHPPTRDDRRGNSFGRDRGDRPRFEDRKLFDATCDKCGAECQVPFRPSGDKPVFCKECFTYADKASGERDFDRPKKARPETSPSQFNDQFRLLSTKLDTIIGLLNQGTTKPVAVTADLADLLKPDHAMPVAAKQVPAKKEIPLKATVKPKVKATVKAKGKAKAKAKK